MSLQSIRRRLESEPRTRIVAFGSSNTDRRIHGLHWFDWLDLGIKHTYGRVHHCINAGVGGDTTVDLMRRFDEDVTRYEPHAVIITIGGNDSNPASGIGGELYRTSLAALCERVRALSAVPVLQTYYAADLEGLMPGHGPRFTAYMGAVRQVARETGTPLVDHLRRWEPLRRNHKELYTALMLDPLHTNPLGNMVIGMDLVRAFGVELSPEAQGYCAQGLVYQRILDALERA